VRAAATPAEDNREESLLSKIARLEEELMQTHNRDNRIKQKTIQLEMELHSARADRDMYKGKFFSTQNRLDQINTNPLPVGVVESIVDRDQCRAVIRLLNGQYFVCPFPADMELDVGCLVSLHQRSMSVLEILPPMVDPTVTTMEMEERPEATYEDVGGLEEQILEVREVVELPLTNPEVFRSFNVQPPNGVLLCGPPGTGKTLIAKAVAHATNARFIRLAAPELVQKFIGEGARLVREIFKIVRENAPAIVFIDEVDAIAARRQEDSQSGEREVNRTLMQLLAEMDGFVGNEGIKILAATNRVDILDPAILRPGRFDRVITLPLPDLESRKTILDIHTRDQPKYGVKLEKIAETTDGFSGAELASVCQEAAMFAIRDRLTGSTRNRVIQRDYEAAVEKIRAKRTERNGAAPEFYA
jgi:proteasome regulatory subunit